MPNRQCQSNEVKCTAATAKNAETVNCTVSSNQVKFTRIQEFLSAGGGLHSLIASYCKLFEFHSTDRLPKMKKLRYLGNVSTNYHKIWYGQVHWPSQLC